MSINSVSLIKSCQIPCNRSTCTQDTYRSRRNDMIYFEDRARIPRANKRVCENNINLQSEVSSLISFFGSNKQELSLMKFHSDQLKISVISVSSSRVIYHGLPISQLLLTRLVNKPPGCSACSKRAPQSSCLLYIKQWFAVLWNTAVHSGIPLKYGTSKS